MKSTISVLLISLSFLLLTSCGGVKLKKVDHSLTISNKTTLTIMNDDDAIGSIKELNYLLAAQGFNMVSFTTAVNAIKYKQPINNKQNSEIQKIFSIPDINLVYALNLEYEFFKNLYGYSYKNFRVSIVDMTTGKVIMYGYDTSGPDETTKIVLKKLAKALAKQKV